MALELAKSLPEDCDYVAVNRRAYDLLASEYRKRVPEDRIKDVAILHPFLSYLAGRLQPPIRILDVGCGNGTNLAMFHEAGFLPVGIDISPAMLEVARETCPAAQLVLGDFLTTPLPPRSFQGVFAKASLHLLPKSDALSAMEKAFDLLVDGGMFYVTTTVADDPREGYYEKRDYAHTVVRFRKFWNEAELLDAVAAKGFTIHQQSYNYEVGWNKNWFNVWAVREPRPVGSLDPRPGA